MQASDYFVSIKNKKLCELSLEELAYVHLEGSSSSEIQDAILFSTLDMVIGEIRHASIKSTLRTFYLLRLLLLF